MIFTILFVAKNCKDEDESDDKTDDAFYYYKSNSDESKNNCCDNKSGYDRGKNCVFHFFCLPSFDGFIIDDAGK